MEGLWYLTRWYVDNRDVESEAWDRTVKFSFNPQHPDLLFMATNFRYI